MRSMVLHRSTKSLDLMVFGERLVLAERNIALSRLSSTVSTLNVLSVLRISALSSAVKPPSPLSGIYPHTMMPMAMASMTSNVFLFMGLNRS